MAGIKTRHVPYKGSAQALTDVVGGQVDYTVETVAGTIGHIKAGRLKSLGVSFARRTGAMPDVPPLAEAAGLPGYDIGAWVGYTAPPGTPREVTNRLSAEIQKILQMPDVKERFGSLGMDPQGSTPEEMDKFLRTQYERYGQIIKSQGIKVE